MTYVGESGLKGSHPGSAVQGMLGPREIRVAHAIGESPDVPALWGTLGSPAPDGKCVASG